MYSVTFLGNLATKNLRPAIPLLLILLLLSALPLASGWRRNRLSLQAMHAILGERDLAQTYASLAASTHPRKDWFLGLIAGQLANPALRGVHWAAYLRTGDPSAPELVKSAAPEDLALMLLAAQNYPAQPEVWFWLGEALAQGGFETQAIAAYQRTLQLHPIDPLPWCRLGSLLRPHNPLAARDAFLHCCFNGDPGSNGCYNAGRIEEELGNLETAIRYYRFSHWSESWRRADELEARLSAPP